MRFSIICLCIVGILLSAHSGSAEDTHIQATNDSRQPDEEFINGTNITKITSKTMDLDVKTSTLVYKTDVTITDPQFTLKTDKLIIVFKGKNKLDSLQAEGSVWLKTINGEATCQKATYTSALEQFTLEHDATLRQPNLNLSADKIVFLIRNGQFESVHCEGNVRGLFPSNAVPAKRNDNP